MVKSVSRVAVTLMMLGLVSGLAGCAGSGDKSTPAPTAAAQSPVATQSTPAAAVKPSAAATGGDQSAALDNYVAAAQRLIPGIVDQSNGQYSEIQILGTHPDTVEFVYTYAQPADSAATASHLDTMVPTLQALSDSVLLPEMKTAGITVAPKVRYTYLNNDGTELWSHLFEAAS